MIVEDKVDNYATLARLLIFAGVIPAHFHFKTTGRGVVQFADTLPRLDLILLDLELPGEDGYEVLAEIRRMTRFQNTLVVAVTGHISVEDLRKAQRSGFDGFLGKPLGVARFPDQLTRILRGQPVWENK
ncbi:MAG: response regulator [Anaerolineae bacterium]|nr:response regulator [Anaerolineae bacterium]